jgi:hypothetical protein
MATIALPTIKEDLGFDDGSLQWVLTAYSLTVLRCCLFTVFSSFLRPAIHPSRRHVLFTLTDIDWFTIVWRLADGRRSSW